MKKYLPKSEYARNSIISIAGVAFAAIIPIALWPFLGRMYTEEQVNLQALFFSITSTLAVPVSLRYAQAVAVADTDSEARNLLVGSFYLSLIFSLVLYIPIFIFRSNLAVVTEFNPADQFWIYLIPVSTFFISVCIALNGWLNRKKAYKAMAYNKSIRRGGEGFFQLLFGHFKFSSGYMLGTFLGDILNFFVHIYQFIRNGGYFQKLNWQHIRQDLKKYNSFPKHNLLPAFLDTLSLYLPLFFVNSHYSTDISGQFAQSTMILALPLALISMALSQVLMQRLSESKLQKKPVTALIRQNLAFLSLMGLAGALFLMFWGEGFFTLFLGNRWALAGQMSSVLVLAYAVKFIVSPLSVIFFSHQQLKMVSFWQYARFAAICLPFAIPELSIWQFIWLNVALEVVLYGIYLAMILSLANRYDKSI